MSLPYAPTYFGSIFGASGYSSNATYVPTSLKAVVLTGGTSIANNAFYGCSSIESITLPNTLTTIGTSSFYNCSSIEEIIVPDSVTSIGQGAFQGCTSLESITLPFAGASRDATYYNATFGYIFGYTTQYSNNLSGYIAESQSFINKQATTVSGATWQYSYVYDSYDYSSSSYNSDYHRIISYYYYIPTSLKHVTITGNNVSNYAFFNCTGLESITLNDTVATLGTWAFNNCSADIVWAGTPTIETIGAESFYNYKNIAITIPNSVKTIGTSAFYGSSLTSIVVPSNIDTIGSNAFYGCTALTNAVIVQ